MNKALIYLFTLLLFNSCSNSNNKKDSPAQSVKIDSTINITAKFEDERSEEIYLDYLDSYNDTRSFVIAGADTAMHRFVINSTDPVFLMDVSVNQTYYLVYPGEKITIAPKKVDRTFLTFETTKADSIRKNELLFFEALAEIEKRETKSRLSEIIVNSYKGQGKSTDISHILRTIELSKYIKGDDTEKAYQFIKQRYDKRHDFLVNYQTKHPISKKFEVLVDKLFQFEFEHYAYVLLKNAFEKKKVLGTELQKIANAEMQTDSICYFYIPTYQNKIKAYLAYSFLKNNLNSLNDKVNFLNKELQGPVKDFCLFLVFKSQQTKPDSSEIALSKKVFEKDGLKYLDYIGKNQAFYENARQSLAKYGTKLKSFDGSYTQFETLMASYKNKVVLLDFWASWCVPCKFDMPYSKKIKDELKNRDVEFVYLSLDKSYNAWYNSAKVSGLVHNSFLVDSNFNSNLSKNLKISSIPRYILIDKKGEYADIDAPRPSSPMLKKKILDLL